MNDAGDEWHGHDIKIRDGLVVEIGEHLTSENCDVFDMSGHVVLPGLVNTHHHFYQTMTRAVPSVQNASLFDWLKGLYPIWQRLTPEMIRISTMTAMAELMLSGCTTSSDHLYLFPNGARLDDSIEGAQEIGMRFHAMRGSMSVGESDGGLPPDSLVENEADILRDNQRLIEDYQDDTAGAMLRIGVAPCSPFSVSRGLMRDAATLARHYNVRLHTHLAENDSDIDYSLEQFGMTPSQYVEELDWVGPDVWHAHCVKLDQTGIQLFARTGTGIAHCPCSNMRLASGIAPVRSMLDSGVAVGLGVDGSASNDSGHLLSEARQAMLLQRVTGDASAFSARDALWMATRGGAQVLGRNDIGHITCGMQADITCYKCTDIALAGAIKDPLAALVFCQPTRADFVFVKGHPVVQEGILTTINLDRHVEHHNHLTAKLLRDE